MNHYREINDRTARKIQRLMLDLTELNTMNELERTFIGLAGKVLPADCLCLNNWSLDWQSLKGFTITADYLNPFLDVHEVFSELVYRHPIIEADHFPTTAERVLKLSDFQTFAAFRENPLFHEVYRHVDAHFQICHTAALLKGSRTLLTWNRRGLDFSIQDEEIFHYMASLFGRIAVRIEEREQLDVAWGNLCGFVDSKISAGTMEDLGERDALLLAKLLKLRPRDVIAGSMGIRRDSVDKRLGIIREKLGLENQHQLLSALADLKEEKSYTRRAS